MTGRRLRLVLVAVAALVLGGTSVPVSADPVTEARKLVRKVASVKNQTKLPPLLTNETAAGMGVLLGAMVAMTGAMADAMSNAVEGIADAMGRAMDPQTGDTMGDAVGDGIEGERPQPPRTAQKPRGTDKKTPGAARVATLSADIERVFRRHGVPTDNSNNALTAQQRARIVRSGRALLADVLLILEKLPESKGGGSKALEISKDLRPERLRYRRISATRVQIIDPRDPKARIEARFESGAWRLHMAEAVQVLDGKGRITP